MLAALTTLSVILAILTGTLIFLSLSRLGKIKAYIFIVNIFNSATLVNMLVCFLLSGKGSDLFAAILWLIIAILYLIFSAVCPLEFFKKEQE